MLLLGVVGSAVNVGQEAVNTQWRRENREEDMKNRGLWDRRREIDDARRFVDEKAEQLKAVGELGTMMAFFSISALCEIRIPPDVNETVLTIFAFFGASVVFLCSFSTLIVRQ